MGKYSDFDLDLNQVKAGGGITTSSLDYTLVTACLDTPNCISYDGTCTNGCTINSLTCGATNVSCNCSMSDLTLCGNAAGGNAGLLRC